MYKTAILLREPFSRLWQGRDPFKEAFSIGGENYRKVKARRTSRFEAEGKGYFIKLHSGIGWKEYFKDIFQFKKPVTGAENEFQALNLLKEKGIPAMTVAAFGRKGWNPAREISFLITEELRNVISLEDLCKENNGILPPALKYSLIRKTGETAGKMHRAGINHRDCYICHFLLEKDSISSKEPVLHVIDLHRAQIRRKVPERYLVKDLAGLCFSAMQYLRLNKRDVFRFLEAYYQKDLRQILKGKQSLLEKIFSAACRLYRKDMKKDPPALFP